MTRTEPTPAKAAKIAKHQAERPECPMPQYTALTAYARGCRCTTCVEARRALSRRCQKAAYDRDPAKQKERQRIYNARRKEQTDATS